MTDAERSSTPQGPREAKVLSVMFCCSPSAILADVRVAKQRRPQTGRTAFAVLDVVRGGYRD
jgi:hypothetical protein